MSRKQLVSLLIFLFISSSSWGAINFPATGTAILSCSSTNDIMNFNTASTIAAWINPTIDVINGGDPRIIDRERVAGDGYYFAITATNSIYMEVSGGTHRIAANGTIPFNTLQYVLVTFDGGTTGTNIHIFRNGVEVSYASSANGAGGVSNSGATVGIGSRVPDNQRIFGGIIYETEGWDVVLSASEITASYNGGKQGFNMRNIQPTHLKLWNRLNKGCSDNHNCTATLVDEIGNHNCTPSGNPIGIAPIYGYSVNSTLKNAVNK